MAKQSTPDSDQTLLPTPQYNAGILEVFSELECTFPPESWVHSSISHCKMFYIKPCKFATASKLLALLHLSSCASGNPGQTSNGPQGQGRGLEQPYKALPFLQDVFHSTISAAVTNASSEVPHFLDAVRLLKVGHWLKPEIIKAQHSMKVSRH